MGVLAATAAALAGFLFVMALPISSTTIFFLAVVLAPMLVALLMFGVCYRLFSGIWISRQQWLIAAFAIAIVAIACFALVVGDVVEELPATVLMMAMLFAGGRIGLQRAYHA